MLNKLNYNPLMLIPIWKGLIVSRTVFQQAGVSVSTIDTKYAIADTVGGCAQVCRAEKSL